MLSNIARMIIGKFFSLAVVEGREDLNLLTMSSFDLRPFLYPAFSWPYKKIEETVAALAAREKKDLFI